MSQVRVCTPSQDENLSFCDVQGKLVMLCWPGIDMANQPGVAFGAFSIVMRPCSLHTSAFTGSNYYFFILLSGRNDVHKIAIIYNKRKKILNIFLREIESSLKNILILFHFNGSLWSWRNRVVNMGWCTLMSGCAARVTQQQKRKLAREALIIILGTISFLRPLYWSNLKREPMQSWYKMKKRSFF